MNDQRKAKKQLIEELISLRQQLAKWNAAPTPSCPHRSMDEPQRSSALPPKPHTCLWEGEFKSLVENSPDAIIRFDKDLRFLYANKVALKVMGIPLASCLGKTVSELKLPRKYYKLWKTQVETIFTTKQQVKFEAEFTISKKYHFYYHARLVPEFCPDGSVVSVLCTLRNIDELKKTELELRASEFRNHKLLSSLPDFLFYLTNEGVYLDYHVTNPDLLYKPHNSRIGKHLTEVLPSKQAQQFMSEIKRANKSGKMESIEYQLPINDTICSMEARIMTYDKNSVLVIVRDITELKHLRQELTRLDQLNLVGEMAATIGHEVRNPMTSVRGFLQFLSYKEECHNFKNYFQLMMEELDRANSIISDFLSLAKNKQVKLEIQNLNTIIKTIAPLLQSNAIISNKSLHLDLNPIPDLPLDSKEIRQLLLNLVYNALDAMPPHRNITIKSFMEKGQVILAVQDEGTGIPPELIEKLGTPFLTTKEKGTGLGLAVCYRIVARHKAIIEIDTCSHGTTFFIKFNQ
ncbi:PAS domain-containing protein [Pelosinus fermentans]|uniref:histidine kinase n=1 Tax=Pelosinus fermentans JBW45 TaxID=1192197 RepID=I9NLQ9_9FIRM|nr:PAS domain-containing protein [Pelosinus fermentans]AJQ29754.1 PAS/PAC sensor signal transduction histidine kinase [Pelosinus fermentans JBW45]